MSLEWRVRLLAAPLASSDPRQLGAYWLAGRLGAGGQGVVYEGYDDAGERVAVKALHANYLTDAYRNQLRREVAALSRVAPFCTARIISADLVHNPPYLVSEYVAGPDLQSWVDEKGPYRAEELLRLAIGIVTALSSIHQAGVMHRDLKPANVLIGPDGPRVIDFGIARTEEMSRSATDQLKGTPRWMAPELFRGDRATPAVDIWAWGTIVLFAATGQAPFNGDNLSALAYQILNHRPDLDRLPPQLQPLVAQALSQDPADRPTAPALLAGLLGLPGGDGHTALAAGQRAADHDRVGVDDDPTLGETAEKVFVERTAEEQTLVPRLLLRMITSFPDAQHTLRKVPYAEFHDGEFDDRTLQRLLEALCAGGLVARKGAVFTLATPALIRAWPRLRAWVNGDRGALNAHHELAEATRNWIEHGRKTGDLLQGSKLDRAVGWIAGGLRHLRLNVMERAYLDASAKAAERRRRNRTLLSAVLAALLMVATGTAALAIYQGSELSDKNETVSRQLEASVGSRVAGVATALRRTDPTAAKQLAIASGALSPDGFDSRSALVTTYNQWESHYYRPPLAANSIWRVARTGHLVAYFRREANTIKLVDLDARKVVSEFAVPGAPIFDVTFSGDGRLLGVIHADGTTGIWDTTTIRQIPKSLDVGNPEGAETFLSEKGNFLVSASNKNKVIRAWDLRTGQRVLRIPVASWFNVETSPDERVLAWNGETRFETWDVRTGKRLHSQPIGKNVLVSSLSYSPNGKILAIRKNKHIVLRLLNENDEIEYTIPKAEPNINEEIFFSPDSRLVGIDGVIWSLGSGLGPVWWYSDPSCHDQVIGPDGRTLRCFAKDGTAKFISLRAVTDTVAFSFGRNSAALSEDGSTLALGAHRKLEIWDPARRVKRTELPITSADGTSDGFYTLSRDGKLLASLRKDLSIEIWDVAQSAKRTTLKVDNTGAATFRLSGQVQFSPDGRTLAVAFSGGTKTGTILQLWDVTTGAKRFQVDGRQAASLDLGFGFPRPLFSPDGKTIIAGQDLGVIETATARTLLPANGAPNTGEAISKNFIADWGDTEITILDASTLQSKFTVRPGTQLGYNPLMAFSPDGRVLASSDKTGQIQLWDMANRRPFGLPLTGFFMPKDTPEPHPVTALAFSADGSTIFSTDDQGRLRTHLIGSAQIRKALCRDVGSLPPDEWKTYIPELPYRRTC
ncbi:WD40 repeat domain-containing serine/threonine-protein kinase [Nonomuraea sp. NPDC005650]|uniref:WD40 repeat domain-containing serine/threonine protein kinase n=1 Tax=Nonomuraea sp. NPDC005650 TaxID=3157045 RepID=UPI0033A06FBB